MNGQRMIRQGMNGQVKVAVPSVAPGGLEAACSDHFGHCDCFTLVGTDPKGTVEVDVVPNRHGNGCNSVVDQLRDVGADVIMVKGIGRRPLMGFQQVGIKVFQGAGTLVGDVVDSYYTGSAVFVDERSSCQGGGGVHGQGHGHCGPQRQNRMLHRRRTK